MLDLILINNWTTTLARCGRSCNVVDLLAFHGRAIGSRHSRSNRTSGEAKHPPHWCLHDSPTCFSWYWMINKRDRAHQRHWVMSCKWQQLRRPVNDSNNENKHIDNLAIDFFGGVEVECVEINSFEVYQYQVDFILLFSEMISSIGWFRMSYLFNKSDIQHCLSQKVVQVNLSWWYDTILDVSDKKFTVIITARNLFIRGTY